jgi:hypothetical protein
VAEEIGDDRRGTSIELTVSGASARATLWDDLAPKTVAALLESLPLEVPLQHCKWSGSACFADVSKGVIAAVSGLESPVVSIYPGVLAVRPAAPGAPGAELLIAYGDAEYRWPDGRRQVTPVGELEPGARAVLDALAATAVNGRTTIRLRTAEARR